VVDDMSVGNETPMVTLSISRFVGPTWFFRGAHMGRVCVRAFIEMSALVYVSIYVCKWVSKKKLWSCLVAFVQTVSPI